MEDITNQPSTADASLYNGQPFDTGLSCQSAELTFRTPSISKDIRNGVSVENVPDANRQWFVLRVSYGRVLKAKEFVEAKGFECYVPIRYKEVKKQGNGRICTKPLIPSFLFIYASAKHVDSLLQDKSINSSKIRLC